MSIVSQSLPEKLVAALRADIAAGAYAVGAKLPIEPELCAHYGVSRTVLREAMSRLKSDGLIDTRQGKGSFVLAPSARNPFRFEVPSAAGPTGQSSQSLLELSELRLGVEGTAAALAARRRTPAQLERLKQCLDAMGQAVERGESGSEADLEFHSTIADATGNSHYRLFMDYLRRSYGAAIEHARHISRQAPGLSQIAQEEHRAVYEAIARGDADAAEAAAKQHIRAAAQRSAEAGKQAGP